MTQNYKKAADFKQEINYVHADRQALLSLAAKRLALRVAALTSLVVFIKLTTHVLLPYISALAYAGGGANNIVRGAGYLVWAFVMAATTFHIHVILARLIMLKPRLFGSTNYL
jgi:hypothetical protein